MLLASGLLLAFWFWTGTDTSLAMALRQASGYLPAGQVLIAQDVRGSLRSGGHIGRLRWEKNGLIIDARQIDLTWQPKALLDRRLKLDTLHVAQLDINDQRPETSAAMPEDLLLPFQVDLTFTVDALRTKGAVAQQAADVSGSYQFNGVRHALKLGGAKLAAGQYTGEASLLARAPFTLDANLQGDVRATIPGNPALLMLAATASVRGDLAGQQPLLDVQAELKPLRLPLPLPLRLPLPSPLPLSAPRSAPAASAMQAQLDAQINPWSTQPIVKARATFSRLNLAMLWPDAPQTLMTGSAEVRPDASAEHSNAGKTVLTDMAWQAKLAFTNALGGAWDLNRLPVDAAEASLIFNRGQWRVQSLNVAVAGGQASVRGDLNTALNTTAAKGNPTLAISGWRAQATLQNINPAALHTQLAPARIDGTINAVATPSAIASAREAVDFDAQLQPSAKQPGASRLNGLRLKNAIAKGSWASGTLRLQTLKIETSDALLQGTLDVELATRAMQGQLQLTLPGGQAQVRGKLSEKAGAGDAALRVSDAARASRWLETLPGAARLLQGYAVQGNGELSGEWTGGWRGVVLPGTSPGASANTLPGTAGESNLSLRGTVRMPQLNVSAPGHQSGHPSGQPPGQTFRMRDVQAELSGSLMALTLKASGQWLADNRRFTLQTSATGGRKSAGHWQAVVGSAQLQTEDTLQLGTWTAQSRQPVSISWNTTANRTVLDVGAGESSLAGTGAGIASILWQPVRWTQTGPRTELATEGKLLGVPMAWLALLAPAQMAETGLRGDLIFDGDWNVLAGDTLKATASLVRRSGDLSIQAERFTAAGAGAGVGSVNTISAGVKAARVTLTADGNSLRVSALWDSERAGQAQADFSTSTASVANAGWAWPADAPLAGTLRAQLPQVGVWSFLAPPGWRIRGTLDANIALAGTRANPQWRGTLNADSLALRSIADGIEFSNGRLRTTLNGQRLEIIEFSVQGAGGGAGVQAGANTGGLLTANGFAEWPAANTGNTPTLSKIRIDLSARAQALRVSARADRRLAVSGNLQVKLLDAKLEVRGALKADQALFILPDENTPSLGDDVVVKASVKNPPPATAPPGALGTAASVPKSNRIVPDVAVTMDMGPDFRVQGRGLNTRLGGTLNLASSTATRGIPRLTGTLTTGRGSYKAYGQQLDIEEGVLRFSGPYDNPALDILAIRPNLTVRVGVQVNGTALSPRVRLYAEPELPDAEKLAWLVLGRSGANGGAEAAVLQQAALALLGGNGKGLSGGLAEALGLDELSFRGAASNADGSTSAAAVMLGKRLSRNFYVAYERSVSGTLGTVSFFYDLSKRFTLRAQTGEQSAIDLIFTVPYD